MQQILETALGVELGASSRLKIDKSLLPPTKENTEDIFVSFLSGYSEKRPIVLFLCESFQRIEPVEASDCQKEMKRLILSYIGIVLQNPEMFPQSRETLEKGNSLFCDILFRTQSRFFSDSLLEALVTHWASEGDELLREILVTPIFGGLGEFLKRQSISVTSDLSQTWSLVFKIFSLKPLVRLYLKDNYWLKEGEQCGDGSSFEASFPLSPLLSIGFQKKTLAIEQYTAASEAVLNEEEKFLAYFFPPINSDSAGSASATSSAKYSLSAFFRLFQENVASLFKIVIRENKDAFFYFLKRLVDLNQDRCKLSYDPNSVTSDCFLFTTMFALLSIGEPFFEKARLLERLSHLRGAYFSSPSSRFPKSVFYSTRLAEGMLDAPISAEPLAVHFFADWFIAAHELLNLSVCPHFFRIKEEVSHLNGRVSSAIEEIQQSIDKSADTLTKDVLRTKQQRLKRFLSSRKTQREAFSFSYLREENQKLIFQFLSVSVCWLKKRNFTSLPEHLVRNILLFFRFSISFQGSPSQPLPWIDLESLVNFFSFFISEKPQINNPHLRWQFVEVFEVLREYSLLGDDWKRFSSVSDQLIPGVLEIFVETENCGTRVQYSDKLQTRIYVEKLISLLFSEDFQGTQKKAVVNWLQENESSTKFCNTLINDISYLLDEAWSELEKILSTDGKDSQLEGCVGYFKYATRFLSLLSLLTTEVVLPFLRPEIGDHLAATLLYNVSKLFSPVPKRLFLLGERFRFDLGELLFLLFDIFHHLARKSFAKSVASDTRSFSEENFSLLVDHVRRSGSRSAMECDRLVRFCSVAVSMQKSTQDFDTDEIPDEYLDPIMCKIMSDPVILPTSNITVDRSTIVSHLLNSSTDPFNRKELSIEQVYPNQELRLEIENFLLKKIKN